MPGRFPRESSRASYSATRRGLHRRRRDSQGIFRAGGRRHHFSGRDRRVAIGTQVKFLRVLENGEYMRVGSATPRRVDVRVIAATNKDLESEVRQGEFRSDLFFRLRSINIRVPALRERRNDIPIFVETFARQIAERTSSPSQALRGRRSSSSRITTGPEMSGDPQRHREHAGDRARQADRRGRRPQDLRTFMKTGAIFRLRPEEFRTGGAGAHLPRPPRDEGRYHGHQAFPRAGKRALRFLSSTLSRPASIRRAHRRRTSSSPWRK